MAGTPALAQGVTGAVIGTVRDADGGVISGATARLESPALIGGPQSVTTNEKGQLRFANLPPGLYTLEIAMAGFATYRDDTSKWAPAPQSRERSG